VINLAQELKGRSAAEETVIRLLEQQSKYGVDQEAMLIYLNSVNLMNILTLIARRYTGSSGLAAPVLPPLAQGAAPAGISLENLLGMMMKLLGNQEGGNVQGGQGLNPAALLTLLGALGQNVDFPGLFNMLGSLFSPGGAPVPGTARPGETQQQAAPAGEIKPEVKKDVKEDKHGVQSAPKREVPKVMVWDQLENRKK
jgi:hypothetical protein